jgi:hypothetical protein
MPGGQTQPEEFMGIKLLTIAAIAAFPAVALAQQSKTAPPTQPATPATQGAVTRTTSAGSVAGEPAGVTQQAMNAQHDPNLIGSPAWWQTHSTADGQPKKS